MDLRLIYALILTVLPISELRGGLPLALMYSIDNGIPIIFIFPMIILLNILVIFFIFYFLDKINNVFLKNRLYKRFFEGFIKRFQKKVDKFEKRYEAFGFFALMLFVAIPLPGTGAWTGCLASWLLGLERKKSVLFISIGVFIAGIAILLGFLGFVKVFS